MTIERMLIGTADAAGDPYFNNVSLLLHGDGTNGAQNNTFLDSSNNYSITRNGNTTQGSLSPFALNGAAYSQSVNGGSGYFDGNGDYLTCASISLGSNNFTIEAFVYAVSLANYPTILSQRVNISSYSPFSIGLASSTPLVLLSTSGASWAVYLQSTIGISANTWNHIAVTRNGSTVTIWVNGVSGGTASISGSLMASSALASIGASSSAGEYPFFGYMSSFRVINGTAIYTSTFTPPTAPLTAISGTLLLCNFTNAGIYDNAAKNDLETVGNAKISTAIKKYGTGSMYFDGNGDYLTIPYSTELKLSSGDWTIEFWIYCTGAQSSASNAIWLQDITGSNYTGIVISANSSRQVQFTSSQTGSSWTYLFQTIGAYSDNTWSHVAICKSNTNVYGFFNGNKNLTLSGFPSTIFSSSDPSAIGVYASNYFNGYIDDFRITKGVARYTANFTPPAQAFPNY